MLSCKRRPCSRIPILPRPKHMCRFNLMKELSCTKTLNSMLPLHWKVKRDGRRKRKISRGICNGGCKKIMSKTMMKNLHFTSVLMRIEKSSFILKYKREITMSTLRLSLTNFCASKTPQSLTSSVIVTQLTQTYKSRSIWRDVQGKIATARRRLISSSTLLKYY